MNILYVSTLCSDSKFREIFKYSSIKPQQQAQKFHSLLSKGLKISAASVYVMSRPPVNGYIERKPGMSFYIEVDNSITYHYLKLVNFPILKHFFVFTSGFINCIAWSVKKKNQEKVVICDFLSLTISASALFASKICGVKTLAIVTDLPEYMQNYTVQKSSIRSITYSLYRKICNFFMYRYDSYIILTQQMNGLVNPNNKPYVVIEGMVDLAMKNVPNLLENKCEERIIIYAGTLHEKYGVKKLIEALLKLKMDDIRLWLFGSGEMDDEIIRYEKLDHRIRYFGVVPNEVVVKEQLKATLLVNPRSSSEEFAKYSFPSKNMEYMASGTPVLTAPLPGMPEEYFDYVYLFEDESVEGMAKTLARILSLPKEELHAKGAAAKEFVLREKNHIVQANRIIDLIREAGRK